SMCPAIHINSRSWLRSSSTHEPSDPPPKVVFFFFAFPAIVVDKKLRQHAEALRSRKLSTSWFLQHV
ncbi:hypothetical protein, partial [Thiolapillus sp.]|uniref:hypothetical protein n=1 Tax=Thiolapillus sp. TaxID=2017437 RepID=UPI003AF8E131